jgi:hypothetical protein
VKKKKLTIASILGVIILLIGVFFLVRISVKDRSLEPKNNSLSDSQEIQNDENKKNE